MFKAPFSFEGRIRRTEYGVSILITSTLWGLFGSIINAGNQEPIFAAITPIIIPLLFFSWAQAAKRCHDLGKSGWWQLIPFYGLWLLFQDGQKGPNKYGEDPKGRKTENKPNVVTPPQQHKVVNASQPKELNNFEKAMSYYEGKGVKQSFAEAAYYLKKAVEEGNNEAKNTLASLYYEGKGVEQSYQDAFNLWKEVAATGNTYAIYNVGLCYYQGKGAEQNKEKAMEYLRIACEQRNDNACNLLNRIKKEIENN